MDPTDRLIRLETLNAIGDLLNAAPTFDEAAGPAVATLLERFGLRAGWLFVTNVAEGDAHHGSFRLAAAVGLPPALASDDCAALRDGNCECQGLLRRGELDRGINVVRCSRLRDAHGDRGNLVMHASVPLLGDRGPVGILNLADAGDAPFEDETLALLATVGKQLAAAFVRSRLQRLRTSQERYAATLEERERLAREMHDALAQQLFAAQLALEVARGRWRPGSAGAGPVDEVTTDALDQAAASLDAAIAELRGLVEVLRPAELSGGLRAALVRLAQRTAPSLTVHLDIDAQDAEDPTVAEVLYKAAQEALHNTLRHAGAQTAWIHMRSARGTLVLRVADDGDGFTGPPEASVGSGLGLSGMRERARAMGGELRIGERPGGGAEIVVEVPWAPGS
ncbi:MAG: GAF domain-containing sensor histidine kinase [Trueperaceae bacterium]